jgi:Holliday junction resolvasome RuvABC endonuclease subunit
MPKDKQHNVLAIDPAEKTGWACSDGTYGLWDFKLKRDENFAMKLIKFKKEFVAKIQVFESVSGRMSAAIMSHSKFVGVMEVWCTENNIPYKGYHAKEIKKHATGNGNANKNLMVKTAIKKYGYRGSDDNVADAICLLNLAKDDYGI